MLKAILRWIYKTWKPIFDDMFVEDFIGAIPKDMSEPAIEFLSRGKDKLERFFMYQSYIIQRRAVSDIKNAQLYQGMLIIIKVLLSASSKTVYDPTPNTPVETKVEKDPLEGVTDFMSHIGKKKTKK